jgi:hypothetical protein
LSPSLTVMLVPVISNYEELDRLLHVDAILLGSRAADMHGVRDEDSDKRDRDWDVVASAKWMRETAKSVGEAFDERCLNEMEALNLGFVTCKVMWRTTLLDVVIPTKETSFAALLLSREWTDVKRVSLGDLDALVGLPPLSLLCAIKESHVRHENCPDWERHACKLSRLLAKKGSEKQFLQPGDWRALEALRVQHFARYGQNGSAINTTFKEWMSSKEIAMLAFEYGLSIRELACRSEGSWLFKRIMHKCEDVMQES